LSLAQSNAIGMIDAAALGGGNVQLSLAAAHGTLTLATTAGLTFTAGANHAASMMIVGSLSSLLAALDGLTYTPATNYSGSASIKMTARDLTDGLSGSATIGLKVTRVAPARVATHHSAAKPAVHHSSTIASHPAPLSEPSASSWPSAGGDSQIDQSNHWAGLAAAIEMMGRP
jgi:hypothetical protein